MRYSHSMEWRVARRAAARRRGRVRAIWLAAVAIAGVLGVVAWGLLSRGTGGDAPELVTTEVWKGPYEYAIVEPGNIESASSTEVKCEVRARGGAIAILDVVPEGTLVQAGDKLVELDSSGLQIDENTQKIQIQTRESLLSEAENTLAAAKLAKMEYLQGLFVSQEKELGSLLFAAERVKESAETGFEAAKTLHAEAIFTALQVESAQSNLEDAINKYDAAVTALQTLRKLTKAKEVALFDANIASAEANVQAQRMSLALEKERLEYIQEQIAKCTIKAPAEGQVVYANETDYRGNAQFIVTPGAIVRERQTIIRLPNPRDMQLRATVNEARITMIRPGLPVSVRVMALGDERLEGEVVKVSQYAEPSMFSSFNIKRYATFIKIKNPPEELRVGMQAEAQIHVEQSASALQLPVQALAEVQGRYFTLVKQADDEYETREIHIGSANDTVATIETGLIEGDEVVMNPRNAGELLELPDAEAAAIAADGASETATIPVSTQASDNAERAGMGRTGGG